jgi:predicted permease
VFSLVNAVLLTPLPWRSPEDVGLIWAVSPSGERTWLSFPELEELVRERPGVEAVAGMSDLRPSTVVAGVGEEVQGLAVSHGFFSLLGIAPSLGRDFSARDEDDGAPPVVIVSDSYWRSRLGATPSAIGRAIPLDEKPYVVIGVLPPTFSLLPASSVLPAHVDVWLPLKPHLASRARTVRFLHAIARVEPGSLFSHADAELQAHSSRIVRQFPEAYPGDGWRLTIRSFSGDVLRTAREVLFLLGVLVALVLLIACANVAQLLLVRGESRRRELAIRTALGAGPARLAGELLAEALVIAIAGSAAGLAIAAVVPSLLRRLDLASLPRLEHVSVDVRVLGFMLVLVLLTLVVSAAAPVIERLWMRHNAVRLTAPNAGRSRSAVWLGRSLVVAQTTLATAVIVATVALTEGVVRLQDTDMGFRTPDVMAARVSLSPRYATSAAVTGFFNTLLMELRAMPGVVHAAATTQLPLSGAMLGSTFLTGDPEPRPIDADLRGVTPEYFAAMQMPLAAGRAFTMADDATARPVAIVDEAFARRLGADGDVIGRRLRWIRQPDQEIEIVGVTRSVRHRGPEAAARETVYRPSAQYVRGSMFVVVRTAGATDGAALVHRAVARVDATQPVADVASLASRLARSTARARTSVALSATLGVLALGLAAIGLYGVLSVGVARRSREFGVRLALGADARSVRRLVLRDGLALTAAGVFIGGLMALSIVRLLKSTIAAAPTLDGSSFALAFAIVFGCSSLALWLPAHRASRADPLAALRSD